MSRIPDDHSFSCWRNFRFLWCGFPACNALFRLFLDFGRLVVMNPCFTVTKRRKNSSGFRWNSFKLSLQQFTRSRFWSSVSGTHLAEFSLCVNVYAKYYVRGYLRCPQSQQFYALLLFYQHSMNFFNNFWGSDLNRAFTCAHIATSKVTEPK